MSTRSVNRARLEARRMSWPEYIADPDGDRERRLQRAFRLAAFWRTAALFLGAVLATFVLLYAFRVLG